MYNRAGVMDGMFRHTKRRNGGLVAMLSLLPAAAGCERSQTGPAAEGSPLAGPESPPTLEMGPAPSGPATQESPDVQAVLPVRVEDASAAQIGQSESAAPERTNEAPGPEAPAAPGEARGQAEVADAAPDPNAEARAEEAPSAATKDKSSEAADASAKKSERDPISDREMLELLDESELAPGEFERAFADRKKAGVKLPGAPTN